MRFERRLKPNVNIDLTPLIDVVFQLVIFFMITSVFKVAPGMNLNLPQSAAPDSVELGELKISVVSEHEIYVNQDRTELKGLATLIRRYLADHSAQKREAVLEADRALEYQLIVSVLDVMRQNGLEAASLLTRGHGQESGGKGP